MQPVTPTSLQSIIASYNDTSTVIVGVNLHYPSLTIKYAPPHTTKLQYLHLTADKSSTVKDYEAVLDPIFHDASSPHFKPFQARAHTLGKRHGEPPFFTQQKSISYTAQTPSNSQKWNPQIDYFCEDLPVDHYPSSDES